MSRAVMLIVAASVVVGAVVPGTGCSDRGEPAAPPPAPAAVVLDAAVDGITTIGSFDPATTHLDGEGSPTTRPTPGRSRRTAEPIGVMLKSTPPGAMVAVDGEQLGRTPRYWAGHADGNEHEFTFNLERHAMARYRFVPITNGVIHATLAPVATEMIDGGLGPIIAPNFAPDAAVAPPPTILAPSDAGPVNQPPAQPSLTPRTEPA
ncbi:MAG: hypothetical protein M3680_34125, partial [Myxococcota bacterium]|nr:hypothetical protein [Myxococcota bacterium]